MGRPYAIQIAGTGISFPCEADSFVLAAMLSSGKSPLKTGCSGGGCGVCRTRVASGEYAVEKKMSKAHVDEKDQGEGWVLLCCIKPRSDLLLESVGEKKNAITAFAGL